MERDNYMKYNILYNSDNDSMIGFVEDLRHYYKAVAKNYIDLELFDEVRDIMSLIEKIDKNLEKRDFIEVCYLDLKYKYDYRIIVL